MSVAKRLTSNVHGDPVLTITVVGTHDVYRFSHHLLRGQVEFCQLGHRALRSLRRQMGAQRFRILEGYFNGQAWKDRT